jgi:MFS family permease
MWAGTVSLVFLKSHQLPFTNSTSHLASAYLFTTCAFLLLFGKFYTHFSIKWVFLSALALFEVGSAVCGAAPTSVVLILGRALAGVGSAGVFAGDLIIIAYSVPLAKRPMCKCMSNIR